VVCKAVEVEALVKVVGIVAFMFHFRVILVSSTAVRNALHLPPFQFPSCACGQPISVIIEAWRLLWRVLSQAAGGLIGRFPAPSMFTLGIDDA
jgi:hypothetical protein